MKRMLTFQEAEGRSNSHHCEKCDSFCDCIPHYESAVEIKTDALNGFMLPEHLAWVCAVCGFRTRSKTADAKETA